MYYNYRFPFVHPFNTKYAQRMKRLSCKIFSEFYKPELSKQELAYGAYHPPVKDWTVKWHNDMRTVERARQRPFDLNSDKNIKYYPPHPQYRLLTHTLREYGLFKDEHRDFNEAMKAIAISKGKFTPWKERIKKKK